MVAGTLTVIPVLSELEEGGVERGFLEPGNYLVRPGIVIAKEQ